MQTFFLMAILVVRTNKFPSFENKTLFFANDFGISMTMQDEISSYFNNFSPLLL